MGNVNINIEKQEYAFIDGATGKKISAEEFARKYPAVGLARNAVTPGYEKRDENADGKAEQ